MGSGNVRRLWSHLRVLASNQTTQPKERNFNLRSTNPRIPVEYTKMEILLKVNTETQPIPFTNVSM